MFLRMHFGLGDATPGERNAQYQQDHSKRSHSRPSLYSVAKLLFLVLTKPKDGIGEKLVLRVIGEHTFAVSHVHVHHSVFCIDPHNGHVTAGDHILHTDWIVRSIEGNQYVNILVEPGAWLPLIPLV